ncbi:hypothetical protein ACLOJK_004586 [Asimina triloba]
MATNLKSGSASAIRSTDGHGGRPDGQSLLITAADDELQTLLCNCRCLILSSDQQQNSVFPASYHGQMMATVDLGSQTLTQNHRSKIRSHRKNRALLLIGGEDEEPAIADDGLPLVVRCVMRRDCPSGRPPWPPVGRIAEALPDFRFVAIADEDDEQGASDCLSLIGDSPAAADLLLGYRDP